MTFAKKILNFLKIKKKILEFNSTVADMKNSNHDRSNFPTSCAGIFIQSHLQNCFDFKGNSFYNLYTPPLEFFKNHF